MKNHPTNHTLPQQQRTRCEVWTRVMGYHRPVSSFNTGKQAEHKERRFFVEAKTAGLADTTAKSLLVQ